MLLKIGLIFCISLCISTIGALVLVLFKVKHSARMRKIERQEKKEFEEEFRKELQRLGKVMQDHIILEKELSFDDSVSILLILRSKPKGRRLELMMDLAEKERAYKLLGGNLSE
jgi:hypothetical protein